jgi:hypothetical protein
MIFVGFVCETCKSSGFEPSALGKGCTFCDGTEGGNPPSAHQGRLAGLEEAARLCVRRSCTWTPEEDKRSQDYREGIEDAASDLARRIRQFAAFIRWDRD